MRRPCERLFSNDFQKARAVLAGGDGDLPYLMALRVRVSFASGLFTECFGWGPESEGL